MDCQSLIIHERLVFCHRRVQFDTPLHGPVSRYEGGASVRLRHAPATSPLPWTLTASPPPPLAQEAAFWLESIPLLDEEAQTAFSYWAATWSLLALCLILIVALAVAIAVCVARGRKDGYDSDDVISKVIT